MKRYSITVFSRTLEYKEYKEVIKVDNLVYDYISQEKTKITLIGKVDISRTDIVTLFLDEKAIYQGVINDYTFDKTYTTVTLLPLQSLLDMDCFDGDLGSVAKVNDNKMTLEDWLELQMKAIFNSGDTYQNIIGMNITKHSSTNGNIEVANDDIYNIYDLTVEFLKVYGLVVDMEFVPKTQTIQIDIHLVDTEEFWVIDTSETDVLDYSMKTSNSKKPNKIVYLNSEYYKEDATDEDKANLTPMLVFYWHPDGFSGYVDQEPKAPRLLPVSKKFKKKKAIEEKKDKDGVVTQEAKSFEQVCKEDAFDSMQRTSYDDELELTVKTDSKLFYIGDIGTRYLIIVDNARYYTMLTSKEVITDKTMLLTFGMARTRLTQIVRENWRITNNESN